MYRVGEISADFIHNRDDLFAPLLPNSYCELVRNWLFVFQLKHLQQRIQLCILQHVQPLFLLKPEISPSSESAMTDTACKLIQDSSSWLFWRNQFYPGKIKSLLCSLLAFFDSKYTEEATYNSCVEKHESGWK